MIAAGKATGNPGFVSDFRFHDGLDITMKQFLHNQGGVPVARLVILPSTASDSESGSDSDGDHSSAHTQIE